MPYLLLPANHYASGWSETHEIRTAAAVTEIAVQYIRCKDEKKEELLLELCRYFHSYIFKYVTMIVSGSLPEQGVGSTLYDVHARCS